MSMRRIVRKQKLTAAEAAKLRATRVKIEGELPELIARHNERMGAMDQLAELLKQLREERKKKGLSLSDLTEMTGMDRSALSKLERGQRPNPTVDTLLRYAEAVGKRLVVDLEDAA